MYGFCFSLTVLDDWCFHSPPLWKCSSLVGFSRILSKKCRMLMPPLLIRFFEQAASFWVMSLLLRSLLFLTFLLLPLGVRFKFFICCFSCTAFLVPSCVFDMCIFSLVCPTSLLSTCSCLPLCSQSSSCLLFHILNGSKISSSLSCG